MFSSKVCRHTNTTQCKIKCNSSYDVYAHKGLVSLLELPMLSPINIFSHSATLFEGIPAEGAYIAFLVKFFFPQDLTNSLHTEFF